MKGSEGAEHVRLIGIIAEPRLEGGGGDCLGDDAEIVAVRDGAERGEHGHEELLLLEGVVEQRGSALLTWYHFGGSAMAAVQNRNKNKSKARSALTLTAGCRSHTRGREERARSVLYSFPPAPGAPRPPGPRPSPQLPHAHRPSLAPWGNFPRMDGRARRNRQCSREVPSGGVKPEQQPLRAPISGGASDCRGPPSTRQARKCWGYMGRARCFSRRSIRHVIPLPRISPRWGLAARASSPRSGDLEGRATGAPVAARRPARISSPHRLSGVPSHRGCK